MNYRVFEIIKFISQKVMEESTVLTEDIVDELMVEGYNQDEIEEAITWIDSYQKNFIIEGEIEIKDIFKEIQCEDAVLDYIESMVITGYFTEDYLEDLLKYTLFSHERDILTLDDIIANDRLMRFCRKEWAEEAFANFKAFNLKKDC